MTCPSEEVLLRCAEEQSPEAREHLRDCPACRETVRDLEATIGELRAAAPAVAPPSGERLLRLRPHVPSSSAPRRIFLAAAAMLIAATGFALFPMKRTPPKPTAAPPRTPPPVTRPASLGLDVWISGGLDWLSRHQNADGSFGSVGLTGLSLLAWFGDDHGDTSPVYGQPIRCSLAYLLSVQSPDGQFKDDQFKPVYGQAVATWALWEGIGGGLITDPRVRLAAVRATEYLLAAQNPGKGWRYSSKCGDNDTSVTFWVVGALASARRAGFQVPEETLAGARAFIRSFTDPESLRVGYNAPRTGKVYVPGINEEYRHHETMSAAGTASRLMMGDAHDEAMVTAVAFLATDPPSTAKDTDVDYYYWHLGTLALFLHDGPDSFNWAEWRDRLAVGLRAKRAEDGSWEPNDRWGKLDEAGRVYATALNVLTLEVPRRAPAKK